MLCTTIKMWFLPPQRNNKACFIYSSILAKTYFCGKWNLAQTPQTNLKFHEAKPLFRHNLQTCFWHFLFKVIPYGLFENIYLFSGPHCCLFWFLELLSHVVLDRETDKVEAEPFPIPCLNVTFVCSLASFQTYQFVFYC